jgi:hypothetical protein
MRQTVPEAQAEGRDMTKGVKKVDLLPEIVKAIAKDRGETALAKMMEAYIESVAA